MPKKSMLTLLPSPTRSGVQWLQHVSDVMSIDQPGKARNTEKGLKERISKAGDPQILMESNMEVRSYIGMAEQYVYGNNFVLLQKLLLSVRFAGPSTLERSP